jgi:hypothetical protein
MPEIKAENAVEVSPESFVSMVLHAARNPTSVVHGLLLGSCKGNAIQVTKAIPICHETPTAPLLETALGLTGAMLDETVVGWYTAPERLTDTQPGPVVMRIAANMATDKLEPVLIVLDNEGLAATLSGDFTHCVMKGFGKDIGLQWMEPLTLKVTSESKARDAAKSAYEGKIRVVDMVDHMEDETCPEWINNTTLSKHVAAIVS